MLVALLNQIKRPAEMEALPRILGNDFLLKHFPKSVKRFSDLKCAAKNPFSKKCEMISSIKNVSSKTVF